MAEPTKLNGVEKAAVLLMTMGEQAAAEILKHMGPKEVQKIGIAMASLQNVSKESVNATMADFVNSLHNQTSLGVGSD